MKCKVLGKKRGN